MQVWYWKINGSLWDEREKANKSLDILREKRMNNCGSGLEDMNADLEQSEETDLVCKGRVDVLQNVNWIMLSE
jgi:hypothetical protein